MAGSGVFDKLQLKDQTDIVVLDAPSSFEMELKALKGVRIHRKLDLRRVTFAIVFVTQQGPLEAHARSLVNYAQGDAVLWFAYPKASSKRYRTQLSRDVGWQILGDLGFEPVRMVAIDDDWSAKRFRRAAFIKTMTRDPSQAISMTGKRKARHGR